MNVLLVDDDRSFSSLAAVALRREGLEVTVARSLHEARIAWQKEAPDLFLLDRRLPDGDGLSFLSEVRAKDAMATVMLVTAHGDIESAVDAIRAGASDYVPKPVELDELVIKAKRALDARKLRERLFTAEKELALRHTLIPPVSTAMGTALHTIARVAKSKSPLLLVGETGTGKEVLARFFHKEAFVDEGAPFVHINCAAVPGSTFESELFGHERGAFTDARSMRRGLAEIASGGTLFLDELGELPLPLQAKLLTFLDHGRFRRLGGTVELTSTARVVAATNRALEQQIARGEFREDLFYRLSVFKVVVPPLRERRDDVLTLARGLLHTLAHEAGKREARLSDAACRRLLNYSFPGNVRELKNLLERALVLEPGPELELDLLDVTTSPRGAPKAGSFVLEDGIVTMEELERRYARHVLDQLGGKRMEAAAALGISYPTFLKRIDGT
jgi:DNA-binding NtrC family response regulator